MIETNLKLLESLEYFVENEDQVFTFTRVLLGGLFDEKWNFTKHHHKNPE